ncbi:MAG: DUF1015 family protein [Planctomycetota bacterium]|jgi:uncharacterized protein (DUF1015 family)
MPKLHPFNAIHYPTPENGDISELIAPPYDVLDEGPKADLLSLNSHNIVKIDLPVTPPKTVGPDEAYEGAGATFRRWLDEGVLTRDEQPAMFAYEQEWVAEGQTIRRRGMFTAVGVEPFGRAGGGIHRHEMTIQGGLDDRYLLMRASQAQMSPVFSVYGDPEGAVSNILAPIFEREPDAHAVSPHDNVKHRYWAITDEATLGAIAGAMEDVDVFIADGHHRYTTALKYAEDHADNPHAGSCLMVLVAIEDPGLIVRATHRCLCGLEDFSIDALREAIDTDGRLALTETDHGSDGTPQLFEDLPMAGAHAVGIYDPATGKTFTVKAKVEDPLSGDLPEQPRVWRELDVAVFHELLVDRIIRPRFGDDSITYKYPHQVPDLIALTHEEPGRLGVIMQATPLESVCDVSRAGGVMPPKSTFFFPKLATGIVINPLD